MKRIFKLMAMVVAVAMFCAAFPVFTGCENVAEMKAIEYKSGLKTEYYIGEEFSTANVVVSLKYSDDTSVEKKVSDGLTFSEVSTAELGEKTITITYLTFECNYTFTVREINYEITGVEKPEFAVNYTNNIAEKPADAKRSEFFVRDEGYSVGDDNAFVFMPKANAYDEADKKVVLTKYDIVFTLSLLTEGEYVAVDENDLSNYVEADTTCGKFNFTEAAVGKSFRLSVKPAEYSEDMTEADATVSFDFNVIDGYNCYSVEELSLIDNVNEYWRTYRSGKGIAEADISAIILHGDIKIAASDIPEELTYEEDEVSTSDADYSFTIEGIEGTKSVVGSLRDSVDVYKRVVAENGSFDIIGNYFCIDASAIPVVIRDDNEINTSGTWVAHAQLIRIENAAGVAERTDDFVQATIKNISFIGNANRTEDPTNGGGLIMSKLSEINSTYYNVICLQWFISFFPQYTRTVVNTIDSCKAYDAYSNFIYCWGVNDLQIKNSEFIGAGGPVIIADHINFHDGDKSGERQTHITVTDSKLESWVAGEEGWFKGYGADAIAGTIKSLSLLLNAKANTGYVRTENEITQFNLVCVYKSGYAEGITAEKISGTVSIDNDTSDETAAHVLDFDGTYAGQVLADLTGMGAPVFQTTAAGFGYYNGTALMNPLTDTAIDTTSELANSDAGYLNLFYGAQGSTGFMGIIMGYFPVVA